MAKRANAVSEYGMVSGIHRWTYPDGSRLEFDPSRVTAEIRDMATVYGFKVKIDRAAALGQTATWQQKRDAQQDCVASLYDGEWSAVVGSLLCRAMVNLYPNRFASPRAVREWINEKAANAKCKPTAIIADLESQSKVRDAIHALRPTGDATRGDKILGELED
jgi:hypothetical protein